MKKTLRFAALAMAVMLMLTLAVGCGGDSSSAPTSTPGSDGSTPDLNEGSFKMPDTVMDYGGKEFVIAGINAISQGSFGFQTPGESASGDLWIEWRTRVEKAYNCKIKSVDVNHNDTQTSMIAKFMAGEKVADLITAQMIDVDRIRLAGDYVADLSKISTLDLNCAGNTTYGKGIMEACTFGNKVLGCNPLGGFIQTGLLVNMDMLDKVMTEKGLTYDLWDMVDKKTWTIDVMAEVAAAAKKDLTGEGKYTSKDQWGLYYGGSLISNLYHNNGCKVLTKNEDGTFTYTASSPKMIDTINKIKATIVDTEIAMPYQASDAIGLRLFKEGKLLFMPVSPYVAAEDQMKVINFDMGLLPVPNMEAGQEYLSDGGEWMGVWFIPQLVEDKEFAGLVLQSLNEDFTLKDFELTLEHFENTAMPNHPKSVEVYRMLQKNITFDLGFASGEFGPACYTLTMGALDGNNQPVGPSLEFHESNMQAYLKDVYNKGLK